MENQTVQSQNYWCRKCFKNIEATGEECPICGHKMLSIAAIKGMGAALAFAGIGLAATMGFCLFLLLIAIFFGTALEQKFSFFVVFMIIVIILIASVYLAKGGIAQWKSGKINPKFLRTLRRLIMSS
jgi:hypothetical protein